MKKVLFAALSGVILTASASFAGNGQAIFQKNGCTACHQAAVDTVGPSLKKIAAAYAGKEDELIAFLKGQHKAIVDPAKFAMMKSQLMKTSKLSDADLKALADFILSHK